MPKKTAKIKTRGRRQGAGGSQQRALLERAVACHDRGDIAEAGKMYRQILAGEPENPDALHLLGLTAIDGGNLEEAKELISRAIVNFPAMPSFHVSLGRVHVALGDFVTAQACYQEAIRLQPGHADAHFHLGNLYRFQQRDEAAIPCYQEVLRFAPGNAAAFNNLGNSLKELGRYQEALDCYQKAVRLSPGMAEAYTNMGNAYKDMNLPQEAVSCYQKALAARPYYADPYNNIGYILQRQGKLGQALAFLHKALEIKPDESGILHNIGNVYKDMGEFNQAIEVYRQALELTPGFTSVHSNILFALNYADGTPPARMREEAEGWWRQQAAPVANRFSFDSHPRETGRRLRVGYVSPDFCLHSVSFFCQSLLAAHDQDRFEIFCYADVRRPDGMTERLKGLATHWRSIVGLSDEAVAGQIFADHIDILVDLAGHTADNRLLVFARRPAPIQVSWLGYPNTTGLANMDYRLTDGVADPEGVSDPFYTERLLRLPKAFLCYGPWPEAPEVSPLPAAANGGITFGSFNNITKLSPRTIGVWAEILRAVPGSRLLLKDTILADPQGRERFFARFAAQGIGEERLVLRERLAGMEEHLRLYGEMDIGLDPFPYNGTTTTCEALWMGVPVVTLRGGTHAARVGVSLLTHAGYPELIAGSEVEYVRLAVSLAGDMARLTSFRAEARGRLRDSSLLDAAGFAQGVESAYEAMWRAWLAGGKVGESLLAKPRETASLMTRERLRTQIASFPFWYHKIDLGDGIVTPGWAPIDPGAYRIPLDLTGKRVLDVGAWDGYWSFEALKRGAREVVAIDDFSDYLGQLEKRDRKAWETFDLCREALGYTDERCKRVEMTIYDLAEETLGRFDVVFFFGTLYHLRYPLLALDRLSSVCDGEIFVESAILDDYSPYRGGMGGGYPNQMVMEFYPQREYGNNDSNWWAPSLLCLINMLAAAGFADCRGWKLAEAPDELSHCRGFAHGRKPNAVAAHAEADAGAARKCPEAGGPDREGLLAEANRLNQLGHQSYQAGRPAEAADYFRRAAELCPDSALIQLNLGVALNDLGASAEAVTHLKRAVALQADLAEAHFNLANTLIGLSLPEEAIVSYQRAVDLRPGYLDARTNLAGTLISLGRTPEAVAILHETEALAPSDGIMVKHLLAQAALAMGEPDKALEHGRAAVRANLGRPEAYGNLGETCLQCRLFPEAVSVLEKAVALMPDNRLYRNNLGLAYNGIQAYGQAILQYRQALALDPSDATLYFNLGVTLGEMGRVEDAATAYRQAIAMRPGYTDALLNLAHACRSLGDETQAEMLYIQAAELMPGDATAWHNLAILKLDQNQTLAAWDYSRRAVSAEPDSLLCWQQLAVCLAKVNPFPEGPEFEEDVRRCLAKEGICRDPLAGAAVALLLRQPSFLVAQGLAAGVDTELAAALLAGGPEFMRSPLLGLLLKQVLLSSLELELLLTAVRRCLLLHVGPGKIEAGPLMPFVLSLAWQCFANEYVYYETAEEQARFRELRLEIERALRLGEPVSPASVAMAGCYLPLWRLAGAAGLLSRAELDQQGLRTLLVRQVDEPLREQELAAGISSLTVIEDSTSSQVRTQYEENPYPRWSELPLLGPSGSLGLKLRQMFTFLSLEEVRFPARIEVLVAGCGTGREAIQLAQSYTGATVLAVDLSRASLAYAQRQAGELGLTNITFAQADILALAGLGRRFDVIASAGVLHHLREPLAGWRVLVDMLRDGGLMRVGLYSEIARRPVVAAREFIRAQGYDRTSDDIRRCRREIMTQAADPLLMAVSRMRDFYSLSECRDLIFHVQEHRFTIPRLREAVEALGLELIGFVLEDPAALAGYRKLYPEDKRRTSWDNWQAYEQAYPETFLGMYNVWLRKPG